MNLNPRQRTFLLFVSLLFTTNIAAQITIGSDLKPSPGAILELKSFSKSDGTTAVGGLSLPRVELSDVNNLYPMFISDTDYLSDPIKKRKIDLQHTGLVVYNVGCMMTGEGTYVWTGTEWEAIVPREIKSTDRFGGANSYITKKNSSLNIPVLRAFNIWDAYKKAGATATATEINEGRVLDLALVDNLSGTLTVEVLWEQTNDGNTYGMLSSVPVILGSDKNAIINIETGDNFGNVLIALKIADKVLWTWHIWVPDGDPTDLEAQIYCYGGQVWMDRNLGATDTISNSNTSYGLYYQFGRMLPFKMANNNEVAVNQNKTGNETTMLSFAIQSDRFILRPFSTSTPHDWYSASTAKWTDRWSGSGNAKSPFDPCPEGWRVPYSKKNTSPWPEYGSEIVSPPGNWVKGFYYTDPSLSVALGYWPAAGHVHCSDAKYIEQTEKGNNWGATSDFNPTYPGRYYRLAFANNYIQSTASGLLSHGLSVRCVGEYE